MDETERPKLSIDQSVIDKYIADNPLPHTPPVSGGEWQIVSNGPWKKSLKITYNGVDITEHAKDATPRLYELTELMHITRPAPPRSLDFEIKFNLTRDEYNSLMRWSGARRRIWTSRKFKHPGGRVTARAA